MAFAVTAPSHRFVTTGWTWCNDGGVIERVRMLYAAGYRIAILTNQVSAVEHVHTHVTQAVQALHSQTLGTHNNGWGREGRGLVRNAPQTFRSRWRR